MLKMKEKNLGIEMPTLCDVAPYKFFTFLTGEHAGNVFMKDDDPNYLIDFTEECSWDASSEFDPNLPIRELSFSEICKD